MTKNAEDAPAPAPRRNHILRTVGIAAGAAAAVTVGMVLPRPASSHSGPERPSKATVALTNYIDHLPAQHVKVGYGDTADGLARAVNDEQYRGEGPRLSPAAITMIGETIAEHATGAKDVPSPDGLPQREIDPGEVLRVPDPNAQQIRHINRAVNHP